MEGDVLLYRIILFLDFILCRVFIHIIFLLLLGILVLLIVVLSAHRSLRVRHLWTFSFLFPNKFSFSVFFVAHKVTARRDVTLGPDNAATAGHHHTAPKGLSSAAPA